jgi:hypothetical protein
VDERRRLSFGGVADLYDHARPSYPSALVDDVVQYASTPDAAPNRAVEVGAGTGKATVLFAARGLDVLAIEEDWAAEIAGTSACLVLDPPEREGLLSDIAAAIDARGGSFQMHFKTALCLARAT